MNLRTPIIGALLGATLALPAFAAGEQPHVTDYAFSFEGPFGTFDQAQLQRGLQVYTTVCAACHGIQYVPIRALGDLGYSDAEIRQYIADNAIFVADDGPDAFPGDEREAIPADNFPRNVAAGAPDLSLMAKARAGFHGPSGTGISQLINGMGGPEYIASLLNGYEEPPACAPADFDGYYNKYFGAGGFPESCYDEDGKPMVEGSWISMAQPIYGDDVFYEDGTEATIEQQAQDVAAFLMWTAEPTLPARKQAGLTALLFLGILTVLLYLTNKKLWAGVKGYKE